MSLKLTWMNPNAITNTVRIFRGDAQLDTANLPTPLATLTAGVNEYVDTTAVTGQTYYYIIGTKTEYDEVFTPNQKIKVADNRGIGPTDILYGDSNLGYYGSVPSEDFVNSSVIVATALNSTGMPTSVVTPIWHKFSRAGKIIYVPDRPFIDAILYKNLYQAGFVYGMSGFGPEGYVATDLTPTDQLRTFDFKGQKYKTRLMRGWNDGAINDVSTEFDTTIATHDSQPLARVNEFNDFIYSLCRIVPLKQRTVNFANLGAESWLYAVLGTTSGTELTTAGLIYRIAVQERSLSGSPISRGSRPVYYSANTAPAYTRAYLSAIKLHALSNTMIWVPIVELIDPIQVVTI